MSLSRTVLQEPGHKLFYLQLFRLYRTDLSSLFQTELLLL